MERFLSNYEGPPSKKGKKAESSSKQESSKNYESTQRKRTFNPSWKESFPWLEYHVVNREGKMFCFVCKRYDRSGSFCVGSTNFKLEAIKAHARSDSHKQNQMRFDATRKPEATVAHKMLMKLNQKTIEQMKILFRSVRLLFWWWSGHWRQVVRSRKRGVRVAGSIVLIICGERMNVDIAVQTY